MYIVDTSEYNGGLFSGIAQDNGSETIINDFLSDCQMRNFTPNTMMVYKYCIRHFLKNHSININMEDLKEFLELLRDKNGYSASTVENHFSALNCFYDWLEWEGVVKSNIIPKFRKRYLRYYKTQRASSRQLITTSKMRDFINSAENEMNKAIFAVFAKTGIRRQELINLDIQDISFPQNKIVLKPHAKRSNRIVYFDEECKTILEKWVNIRTSLSLRDRNALFVGKQKFRIYRDDLNKMVSSHAEKLGFHNSKGPLEERFTPHCFRHWFTTELRRAGCPRSVIQELRGDIRKEAIDVYDHITPEELREYYLKFMPKLNIY